MATAKGKGNNQKLLTAGGGWRTWTVRMLVAASVTLNIAFFVLFLSLATTHALDGLFMANGLDRYCAPDNDDKFTKSAEDIKAMREYICNAPEVFNEGYYEYLDAKGIPRPAVEE